MAGPIIGGSLVAASGAALVFAANAGSYLLSAASALSFGAFGAALVIDPALAHRAYAVAGILLALATVVGLRPHLTGRSSFVWTGER